MLKIGWAKKNISSDRPYPLGGQAYVRFSKFILDPIFVTALTVQNGDNYVIFLSADVVDISADVLNSVREKVKEAIPEIDPLNILINATHCHSAPMIFPGDGMGEYGNFSDLPHDGVNIATERAVKCRGYSANLFSNLVTPQGGQQLVNETLEELNGLYKK